MFMALVEGGGVEKAQDTGLYGREEGAEIGGV